MFMDYEAKYGYAMVPCQVSSWLNKYATRAHQRTLVSSYEERSHLSNSEDIPCMKVHPLRKPLNLAIAAGISFRLLEEYLSCLSTILLSTFLT
jgi:hypothetical protein